MTTFSHAETHQMLRKLLGAIDGLPEQKAWELVGFTPTQGVAYIDESYVPATGTLLTTTGNGGVTEYTGLYMVRWFGVPRGGPDAIHAGCDAILAAFPPGAGFAMPSGLVLRIRGDVAPMPKQIIPQANGFAVCPISIPWRVFT